MSRWDASRHGRTKIYICQQFINLMQSESFFQLLIVTINLIILLQAMPHQKKRYSVSRSKYAKILLKTKLKFLRKIITEGFSIKDSAIIYDINYSTAKTLMRQYRADSLQLDLNQPIDEQTPQWDYAQKRLRCSYRTVETHGRAERTPLSDGCGVLNLCEEGASSLCSNSPKDETSLKTRAGYGMRIEIVSSTSFE